MRQSERVRVGCLAQIVNVIAPLMTNATSVLRQTIYYPYAWALKYARGDVLDLLVESETYPIKATACGADFARDEQVPFLDVVATLDPQNGRLCRLHAQSRSRRRAGAGARAGRLPRRRACSRARR